MSKADKVVTTGRYSQARHRPKKRFRVSLTHLKKSLEIQTDSNPLPNEGDIQKTIGTPAIPNLSLDPSLSDTPHASRETIREWFQKYPGIVELRINPFKLDGFVNTNYMLGKRGLLYHSHTGKVGRPQSIDWNSTANAVMDRSLEHIRSSTSNAIETIERFYTAHPEYGCKEVCVEGDVRVAHSQAACVRLIAHRWIPGWPSLRVDLHLGTKQSFSVCMYMFTAGWTVGSGVI